MLVAVAPEPTLLRLLLLQRQQFWTAWSCSCPQHQLGDSQMDADVFVLLPTPPPGRVLSVSSASAADSILHRSGHAEQREGRESKKKGDA